MHRRTVTIALLLPAAFLAAAAPSPAQSTPTAEQILAASIDFHDPGGVWSEGAFRLELAGTRPIAGPTFTEIVIDNRAGVFHYARERWSQRVESTVTGDECDSRLVGIEEPTEQQIERFGLSCDRMRTTRDYHVFLYGLPMKLHDEGARVDPEPVRTTFQERDVWQLRVTYDPEVGTDTWYFYFAPESFELVGYRFYHDEAANDGEYIVLDRIEEGGGLRLPKARSWFMNADDSLVGTDTVRAVERVDVGR